jgi:hypothetical protein
MKTQITDVEETIKVGPASYKKGLANVGGRLTLTDKRLVFKPHALNLGGREQSYPLEDLGAILFPNTMFFIPNGLTLVLKDGRRERFVVYARKEWLEKIKDARAKRVGHG